MKRRQQGRKIGNKAKQIKRCAVWIIKRLSDGPTNRPTDQRTDTTEYRGTLEYEEGVDEEEGKNQKNSKE